MSAILNMLRGINSFGKKIWLILALGCPALAFGTGLNWPTNQLLPTFSSPVPVLDMIDITSASTAEVDLFASLEGIVNRTQPQIACVSDGEEGKLVWLDLHNLKYAQANGYSLILKYRSYLNGLVVTDPGQPDTLNLATTVAGVSNVLICDPILLPTLTNAPYNLSIVEDLRGRFTTKYQVYSYLYTNYWPNCTHRICSGLSPTLHGLLRDYLVAVKAACVWLDPGNGAEAAALSPFMNGMTANKSIYVGWWPDEATGLNWIYQFGIPVLASDTFHNGSVFSGVFRPINVPPIPPPPPLQNKVYVSLILSDGDNIQYMQHVMNLRWNTSARGAIPLGWTVTALAADMDPTMLNYYWSTATTNDCLISGPSGAGYTHMQKWNAANLAGFAKITDPYLQRAGLRVITVWDDVTTGVAQAFATNCPTLLGLTDQNENNGTRVDLGLRTILLTVGYGSDVSYFTNKIASAAAGWNGTAPIFIAAQAVTWNLQPSDMVTVVNALNAMDPNKYVFVRPDHLFMLYNRVFGKPSAVTISPGSIAAGSATLRGEVAPNATNAFAWMEWGTNNNYGAKTAVTSVGTTGSVVPVNALISGLSAQRTYHYRVVASNALGLAWGADKQFTTGGRIQVWGSGALGETNVPAGLTNIVAIGGGASHGLGLKNDGTVIAWGRNDFGQTNVPAGLSNVIEVAGGVQHSLALLADGTVVAWGDNTFGQTNIPAGLGNVMAIAAGDYHNLALKSDGTVTAWGQNTFGQTNIPVGLSNVVSISAGTGHNLALKADDTVTAWGLNASGQTSVPAGLNNVIAVAAGQSNSMVLKADGISATNFLPVLRWVADSLSGSDGSSISSWTDVLGGKNATQSSVGNRPKLYSNVVNGHKVARFASGSSQYLTVAAADSAIAAAGSFALVVVLKTSTPGVSSSIFYQNTGIIGCEQPGVVPDWAFGLSGSQLGAGLGSGFSGCGSDLSFYGGNVTDGNPHIAMYVRSGETISLYVDGAKVASQTGLCTAARGNYNFQIGAMVAGSLCFNGDIAEIQLYDRGLTPWEITSVNETLAANYGIGGAAGIIVAWGSNSNGQINAPKNLTNVLTVASGGAFNLALKPNGTVTGWGGNNLGQTNVPAGLTNVTAIAGGSTFALAIGNQPPQANDLTNWGYVNRDLLIQLPVANPDGSPLNFRILSLPVAGELYQNVSGVRGVLINAVNPTLTDPAGQLIFAPAAASTGNPYATFDYMVDDGLFSSGTAKMTVNIGLPTAPQFSDLSWIRGSPGGFNLNFSGSSNATYSVWAATNLVDWAKIGTATESSPAWYEFIDSAATNWPQRFYRISAP